MARDPQALVEDLDGVVGDAHVDELADEAEGHGVPVAVGLDVIVGRHAAALPAGQGIGFGWQRLEGSLVESGIQCGYHGLIFDASGRCVTIPGQSRIIGSGMAGSVTNVTVMPGTQRTTLLHKHLS